MNFTLHEIGYFLRPHDRWHLPLWEFNMAFSTSSNCLSVVSRSFCKLTWSLIILAWIYGYLTCIWKAHVEVMVARWELWDLNGIYIRYTSHNSNKFHKSVKCTTHIFLIIEFLLLFCMSSVSNSGYSHNCSHKTLNSHNSHSSCQCSNSACMYQVIQRLSMF